MFIWTIKNTRSITIIPQRARTLVWEKEFLFLKEFQQRRSDKLVNNGQVRTLALMAFKMMCW